MQAQSRKIEYKPAFTLNTKLQTTTRKTSLQLFSPSLKQKAENDYRNTKKTMKFSVSFRSNNQSTERLKQKIIDSQHQKVIKFNWSIFDATN